MAAITICSDFGAPQTKVSHCFHCLPIYLPWSDGTGCHDLNAEFSKCWVLSQLFHYPLSLSSRGSLVLLLKVPCMHCCSKCPWPMLLLKTPRHSQASLDQSLVGSLLLSSGSWCAQGLFVPSKCLFLESCVSYGGSMLGLMVTSSKSAYAIPRSGALRAPAPEAGHSWPEPLQEMLRHTALAQSLWGLWVLVCTRFIWALECLSRVWGLSLNMISPLLPSCCDFSFALAPGVSFFGGIQHSPVNHGSAVKF